MKYWIKKKGINDRRKDNIGKPSMYDRINKEIAKWLPYFIF